MSMDCVIKFYKEYFTIKHKILVDLYGDIIGRLNLLLLNVKPSTNQRPRYKPEVVPDGNQIDRQYLLIYRIRIHF